MEKIYRELEDGTMVKGIGLPAFIHNLSYYLVTIKIYEDGVIDCWGEVDLEGFVQKIESGWVVTRIPPGQTISRHHSFTGTSDGIDTYVEEEDFLKEVKDVLGELQGRGTSSDRCRAAFVRFLDEPGDVNIECLREAYASMPKYVRMYVLGDMDAKDSAIRRALESYPVDAEIIAYWKERYAHLDKV